MSSVFFISVELRHSRFDYAPLTQKLADVGARLILPSGWLLRGDFVPIQILNLIRAHVAPADKVFIVEVCGGWASLNAVDLDREGMSIDKEEAVDSSNSGDFFTRQSNLPL